MDEQCPMNDQVIHDTSSLQARVAMSVLLAMLVWLAIGRCGLAIDANHYAAKVRPVLQQRCFACHAVLKREAGLRLDTAAFIKQGGDSGAAIAVDKVDSSLLLARITSTDQEMRMPPEGEPLTSEQISVIRDWIAAGAPAPANEVAETDPREHWAFKSPLRPAVPTLSDMSYHNPIDVFLERARQAVGVRPVAQVSKDVLLRRVYLDLIGLPPNIEELEAFAADPSPRALETVVDRLLDSPHYGERWGRHWMDIWRYSDWWGLGAEVRNSQKHIWHFRDWIIESLNADKGYDQMLREMLAADELYPNDLEKLRATGFLARQYFKFNRTSWLDELIEHTSKSMLGLTFNCGKCHDHKYDPLEHVEYYRLRAIFEPYQVRTDMVEGEVDLERDGIPRAFDCNLDAGTYVHMRGDDRNPDKNRVIEPAIPKFLAFKELQIQPIELPVDACDPGLRPFVAHNHLSAAQQALDDAQAALRKINDAGSVEKSDTESDKSQSRTKAEMAVVFAEHQWTAVKARAAADAARASGAANAGELATTAAKCERAAALLAAEQELKIAQAEFDQAGAKKMLAKKRLEKANSAIEAAKKAVELTDGNYTPLLGSLKTLESNLETEDSRRKPFPRTSTGRRTAFANWLTDSQNPLVARVAVNHIWARHFGTPLVPTVFDFGRKGTPPVHPELVDWLATELVENDWSMKHLHRLIVLSGAYQLSSSTLHATAENLIKDSENRYYWRANPRRMEAQIVRDGLLYLADELDTTMGGPSIPAADVASRRRSLYYVHSHNEHNSFLSTYDDASVLECYRRAESIVPQQALALENSQFATDMAAKVAARIERISHAHSNDVFARLAFRAVISVQPNDAELQLAVSALEKLTSAAQARNRENPQSFARQQLVRALFNHNDYVTIR